MKSLTAKFFVEDVHRLDPRYENCLNSHDDYLEKQFKLRNDMLQ